MALWRASADEAPDDWAVDAEFEETELIMIVAPVELWLMSYIFSTHISSAEIEKPRDL
jgi:hypothetical protein